MEVCDGEAIFPEPHFFCTSRSCRGASHVNPQAVVGFCGQLQQLFAVPEEGLQKLRLVCLKKSEDLEEGNSQETYLHTKTRREGDRKGAVSGCIVLERLVPTLHIMVRHFELGLASLPRPRGTAIC